MRRSKLMRKIICSLIAMSLTGIGAVSAEDLTSEAEEMGMFYATADIKDDEIKIEFSMLPEEIGASDLSVINTETGEELSVKEPYFLSRTMVIPLNEKLDATVEYCIILPEDMESLDGDIIYEPYIYFVSPMDRENTQQVVIVNDTFDDYVKDGELPPNWYGRTQGNYNDFNIYSDDEHDKAFYAGMNGLVQVLNTRNFGKAIDYKFKMEFDYKQTAMNKYIKGEDDPNLVQAVYDSVKSGKPGMTSIDQLNQNMRMLLAPVAEDGKARMDSNGKDLGAANFLPSADRSYVSNDKVVYPDAFFQLYGDRLGFGNGILPSEGNYVRIEKDKWYHIELEFDMENLEVTGYIDGEQIGPVSLPAGYKDAQYGTVAARASFWVENPVKFEIIDGSVNYIDSVTGEEKTFSHTNDSNFVIDNFKITNEEPEFKPLKTRLVSVDGEKFEPLREIKSVINKMEISFTSGVDTASVTTESVKVCDADGNEYSFEVEDYNEEDYTVELAFDKFLPLNQEYTVLVRGVESNLGAEARDYTTSFSLGNGKGLYVGNLKVLDGYKNEITGAVNAGTVAFFEGYMAEIAGNERNLNLVLASYKNSENGERMVGQKSKTITLKSAEKTVSIFSDMIMLMIMENVDSVKAFVYELDGYTKADGFANIKALKDSVLVYGNANPKEQIILDIPADKEQYATNKDCTMVYRKVINADENGEFSFKLSTEKFSTGEYTVYVYRADEMLLDTGEFIYATDTSVENAVAILNLSTDKAQTLSEQYINLGIALELYNAGSNETVAVLLDKMESLPENDAEEAKNILNKLYLITAVQKGSEDNLFDYAQMLELENEGISEWMDKEYVTEQFEKSVTAKLEGKNFTSVDDFYDALTEQFVLSVVELKDGYGNTKEIVKAYENEIGVAAEKLSEAAFRKTAGKEYESYAELKKALEANNKTESGGGGGGGSSSGGGGGSSSGGGSKPSNVTLPIEENEVSEAPLLYDIFEDIENVEWAKPAIVYLAEQGIINGTSKTTFSPNNLITREEMAKILVNTYLSDKEEGVVPFKDADKTAWYYPYIAKAYGSGVVKGYSESIFGVGDYITRQDLAVMVYNASLSGGKKYANVSDVKFDDDEEIAEYAKTAVYALKGENAINGVDGSNFSPKGRATRAEAAKIIYSLLKL